jgi:uncharacterized repeat protein (TIGR01451 family)
LSIITRDLVVTKSGDQLGKVGDDANYTVTIFNSGDVNLYPQSITDSLVGSLAASSFIESDTDNNILEVGETWTLFYQRTVLAGDPDQLVNTVTAVFDTAVGLDGIEVTHPTATRSACSSRPCRSPRPPTRWPRWWGRR